MSEAGESSGEPGATAGEPGSLDPESLDPGSGSVTRRQAVGLGVAGLTLGPGGLLRAYLHEPAAAEAAPPEPPAAVVAAIDYPQGYGRDPPLLNPARGHWARTLSSAVRTALPALVDTILPAEDEAAAPSALGVVEFIDEWLSAPYPQQRSDRILLEPLLEALASLPLAQRASSLEARLAAGDAAVARLVELVAGGFVATPAGARAIGFRGNEPRPEFEGPPADVLALLASRAAAR